MRFARIIAAAAAVACCAAAVSCGGKSSSSGGSSSSSEETSSSAAETSSEAGTSSGEGNETTSDAVTEAAPAVTEPATEDVAASTEPAARTDIVKEALPMIKEFYAAYLSRSPRTVYDMFSQEEIKAYNKLIEPNLDGKKADEIFSEEAILSAIGQSMDGVCEIRAEYQSSEADEWAVDVDESSCEAAEKEILDRFNETLGLKISDAVVVNTVIYRDEANDETFTGNVSAFVKIDDKLYLSYSSLLQSELLNYIDL